MCGIVGVINRTGKDSQVLSRLFADLLLVNSIRGVDSTGVLQVNDKNLYTITKSPVNGIEFLEKSWNRRGHLFDSSRLLLGHNRAATVGVVSEETAHPFITEKYIGVHNGTLTSYHGLAKGHYKVDSQYLLNGFSENGITETLEKTTGAYACVLFSLEDCSIKLLRNKERPLFLAKIQFSALKTDTAWVFASELGMLEWICARNGCLILKSGSILEGEIVTITRNNSLLTSKFTPYVAPIVDYKYTYKYQVPLISNHKTDEAKKPTVDATTALLEGFKLGTIKAQTAYIKEVHEFDGDLVAVILKVCNPLVNIIFDVFTSAKELFQIENGVRKVLDKDQLYLLTGFSEPYQDKKSKEYVVSCETITKSGFARKTMSSEEIKLVDLQNEEHLYAQC